MQIDTAFRTDVLLKHYSTFGIGGAAKYFIEITDIQEAKEALSFCHRQNLPFMVLGKGSNTLFDDRGYEGVILLNKIQSITWQDSNVTVGGGYSFSLLGTQSAKKELSGLEFAAGIPGTVGGAVFMNAGANSQETCTTLLKVEYIDHKGCYRVYDKKELTFSYRSSSFQGWKGCIVGATFGLTPKDGSRLKQKEMIDYRMKTQPYKNPSIGCVFRNPDKSIGAGALIEKCGLKGVSIGGAQVSELHANFIVNMEEATAENVLELIALVKKVVMEKTGKDLEIEVKYIPYGSGK